MIYYNLINFTSQICTIYVLWVLWKNWVNPFTWLLNPYKMYVCFEYWKSAFEMHLNEQQMTSFHIPFQLRLKIFFLLEKNPKNQAILILHETKMCTYLFWKLIQLISPNLILYYIPKSKTKKKLWSCWGGQFTVWFQEEDLKVGFACCTTICVIVNGCFWNSDLETEFSPCLFSMKRFLMTRVDRGGKNKV